MKRNAVLLDEATGLYVGWYFWVRVLDEVNRSARYGAPFGLLMLDVERPAQASRRSEDEALAAVATAVRSTDLAGLVGPGRVAVLLIEQEPEAAEQARAGILVRLAALAPAHHAWRAQLHCYPRDGAEISRLLASCNAVAPEAARAG